MTQSAQTRKLKRRFFAQLSESEQCKFDGKYGKALELAERVLIEDPACPEAAEEVADNLFSLHQYEKAKKAAEYAVALDEKSFMGHYILGFIDSIEEKWAEARDHFLISNEGQPNNAEILRCLGWVLFQLGDQKEGFATLQRARVLRSDDPNILCDMAACEIERQEFLQAEQYLQEALAIDPEDYKSKEMLTFVQRLVRIFEA